MDGVEGEEGGGDGREAGGGGEDAAADGGDERRGQGVQKDVGRVKAPAAPRTQRVVQPGIKGEKINEDKSKFRRLHRSLVGYSDFAYSDKPLVVTLLAFPT